MTLPTDIKWTPYAPHVPEVPQHAFLWLNHLEAFYGGAAGGGKSDALLMAALQYVDVPGYAAIIFRKTYTDLALPGAIMDRSKAWLMDTDAEWNETDKQWTFPSGATLNFAYLKSANDKYRYQGAEFQYIAFDELTQFPETDYLYLFSRLRSPALEDEWGRPLKLPPAVRAQREQLARIPLRMRSASNPGGKYHHWVARRFPVLPGDSPSQKENRIFIPAKLRDNPHVNQKSYRQSLAQLDEETQAQLLEGDWTARQPGPWAFKHEHIDAAVKLGAEYDRLRRAGQLPPPVNGSLFFGQDYGEHAHLLIGWPLEGRGWYIVKEVIMERGLPDEDMAPQAVEAAKEFGYPVARSRFDSSKPESQRLFYRKTKELTGSDLYAKPSPIAFNKYKRSSVLWMRAMLRNSYRDLRHLGVVAISREGCPLYTAQMYDLQFKPPDDLDIVKEEDHGPDAGFALIAPDGKRMAAILEKDRASEQNVEIAA